MKPLVENHSGDTREVIKRQAVDESDSGGTQNVEDGEYRVGYKSHATYL